MFLKTSLRTLALSLALALPLSPYASEPPGEIEEIVTPGADDDEIYTVWTRVRDGFKIPNMENSVVDENLAKYSKRPDYLQRMANRSQKYLYHIIEEVTARGMPTEIALLPFVESAFVTNAKAAGLWQFMPATGKHYELDQTMWKDERYDVLQSTAAALTYLQRLHDEFDDWPLAFAAYNWGEGNVRRAIKRNQSLGLPTDYMSLKMPAETRNYYPKLQAIKNIVQNPNDYGIKLPTIYNEPFFVQIFKDQDIDVKRAAKLAGMSHEEFWNIYTTSTAEVKKNNQVFSMSVPKIVDGTTEVGTATKKIVWSFNHGELGKIGAGGSQFVATVTVKNKLTSSEYPASITFKFTVNVKLPEPTLDATENDIYWTKDGDEYKYFNVNVSVPNSVASPASDCQFRRALTEAYSAYTVKGLPGCESARYKVIKTYSNGNLTSPVMSGVQIDGNYITLDKSNAAVKAALNSANGLQAVVAHIYTMSNGDKVTVNEFMVDFIRPVNLNMPSGIAVIDAKTGGDVADFQWNGLLTDWRNEAIVKDSWSWVENVHSYWKRVCTPEFEYVQGHEEMVTPAQLDVEYGTIKFTTTTVTTMYTGKATYRYYNRLGGSTKKTYTTEEFLTQAEVDASLEAQKLAGWPLIYPHVELDGDIIYTEVSKPASTTIEYDYVKSINYVPAVYKWVEGNWTMVPHRHTEKPAFEGTSYGQISGCWEWTKKEWGRPDWNPGQYWFFYGPFGDVTLDLNKVTTSLEYNGNKLPDGATLVQTGNTVKYVNVSSPVGYTYQIFIPATVNYGWGTTSSTLTITVNPNN